MALVGCRAYRSRSDRRDWSHSIVYPHKDGSYTRSIGLGAAENAALRSDMQQRSREAPTAAGRKRVSRKKVVKWRPRLSHNNAHCTPLLFMYWHAIDLPQSSSPCTAPACPRSCTASRIKHTPSTIVQTSPGPTPYGHG
jgi:hypothetical protein